MINTRNFRQRVRELHGELGKLEVAEAGYAKLSKRTLDQVKSAFSKLRLPHRAITAWQDAQRTLLELGSSKDSLDFVAELKQLPNRLELADDALEATVKMLETSLRLLPSTA